MLQSWCPFPNLQNIEGLKRKYRGKSDLLCTWPTFSLMSFIAFCPFGKFRNSCKNLTYISHILTLFSHTSFKQTYFW